MTKNAQSAPAETNPAVSETTPETAPEAQANGPVAMVSAAEAKRREKLAEVAASEAREAHAFAAVLETVVEMENLETPAQALVTARLGAIDADNRNLFAGYVYADMLSDRFGILWPTYREKDIPDLDPEDATKVRDFFREKEAYYAHYKEKFAGIGKRPNPTTSWRRFENYAVAKYNRENNAVDKAKETGGGKLEPIAALRRDLPGLYLRVSNDKTFGKAEGQGLKLPEIGKAVHAVLALILSPTELQALAEKVGK